MAWFKIGRSALIRQSTVADSMAASVSAYHTGHLGLLLSTKVFPSGESCHSRLQTIMTIGNGECFSESGSSGAAGKRADERWGVGFGHRRFYHSAVVQDDSYLDSVDEEKIPELEPTRPGEKPRVVVLGTGWGACRFLKELNTSIYDIVCISPRNHMVFTPLLASTCVGTLEFRTVAEPVSRIQPALAGAPNSYFYLASCTGINTEKHEVIRATPHLP